MCCLILLKGCWKVIVPGPPETQVANNVVGFLTSTLRSIPSLSESTTNGAGSSSEAADVESLTKIQQQTSKVIPTHRAFGTCIFSSDSSDNHLISFSLICWLKFFLQYVRKHLANVYPVQFRHSLFTFDHLSTQVPKFYLYTAFYQERVSAWTHRVDGVPSNVIVVTNL